MRASRAVKCEEGLIVEQAKCLRQKCNGSFASVVNNPINKFQQKFSDVSAYPYEETDNKSCFLTSIIERPVGTTSGTTDLIEPFVRLVVPHRKIFDLDISSQNTRKSIFAREMENCGVIRCTTNTSQDSAENNHSSQTSTSHAESIKYLKDTSPQSINGNGLGARMGEVMRIHQENIDRLSEMSEEEILIEREKILSSVDHRVLSFLVHKNIHTRHPVLSQKISNGTKSTNDVIQSGPYCGVNVDAYPVKPNPTIPHMDVLEPDKLEWTLDLPVFTKQSPIKLATQRKRSNSGMHQPIEESSNQVNVQTRRQARFDLSGLVVPPDTELETHLGLHHHGEEPEAAGYTVVEIFHLCRSAVPAQRRLALSMLASSLGQTRLGYHIDQLAPIHSPSLICGLLAPSFNNPAQQTSSGGGIIFLLRWCLDEAVTTFTSNNATGSTSTAHDPTSGVSLSIIVECIRGLANLVCDTPGEVFLNYSFEWHLSVLNEAHISFPPVLRHIDQSESIISRLRTKSTAKPQSDDMEVNHSVAAVSDPVYFLFTHTQLARRIAWLLAPGKGRVSASLTPDTIGLWLPSLIVRGIRHSTELAHRIFHTPEFVTTLCSNYLPINEDLVGTQHRTDKLQQHFHRRPMNLTETVDLPIPSVLRLFRIWMQTSSSIRLAIINDHQLLERCLSYLLVMHPGCCSDKLQVGCLFTKLPFAIPLQLVTQLQIEALRCLDLACDPHLHSGDLPHKSVCIMKCNLMNLFEIGHCCWRLYHRLFIVSDSSGTDEQLIVPLLTSWVSFLVNISTGVLTHKISIEFTSDAQSIINSVLDWCVRIIDHVRQQLKSDLVTPIWNHLENKFTRAGVTTSLIFVALTSISKFCYLFHQQKYVTSEPYLCKLDRLWNLHLCPLFKEPFWNQILMRFVNNESVLTGAPTSIQHLNPIFRPQSSMAQQQILNSDLPDWTTFDSMKQLQSDSIRLIRMCPDSLPNYGSQLYFQSLELCSPNTCGFTWPAMHTNGDRRDCDQLEYDPKLHSSRFIPLIGGMIEILYFWYKQFKYHLKQAEPSMESLLFAPFIYWLECVCNENYLFRWRHYFKCGGTPSDMHTDQPYVLIGIEMEFIGRVLLLLSELVSQQNNSVSVFLRSKLCSTRTGNLIHRAALSVLPYFTNGQEHLLYRVLNEIVFDPMHIELNQTSDTSNNDFSTIFRNISSINKCYNLELLDLPGLLKLQAKTNTQQLLYADLFKLKYKSLTASLLRNDWYYTPITNAFLLMRMRAEQGNAVDQDANYQQIILSNSMYSLQWLTCLIKLNWRLNVVSCATHLILCCLTYPAAGALGFPPTGSWLAKLICWLGSVGDNIDGIAKSIEETQIPPTCISFYDIFTELINHYNAVSYSSPVLANLLLWPCQQLFHIKYRRAIWGEFQHTLMSLRVRLDQLLIPLKSFLEPEESDINMIRLYAAALTSGCVHPNKQPLMFLIALHHLNRYLFKMDTAFFKQFVQLIKFLSTQRSEKNNPNRFDQKTILNLIHFYKQPHSYWLEKSSEPLLIDADHSQSKLTTDEPLIRVLHSHSIKNTNHCDVFDSEIVKSLERSGIVCYKNASELPKRRKVYWEHVFGQ